MGHPNASVTVGIPATSSDGKYHSRYPRGDKFALLASVAIRKTPSGIIDSRYPDGDDRAGEIPLVWNTSGMPTLENLTTGGSSFSVNVRAMLSEPGSPAATITVESVSGDNTATEGWSISGNNLVNPLSDAGAGVLRLVAVRSGVTVYSAPFVWSKQAPAPADTLAPTVVTGLTAVPAVGQIALAWDASSDPHDGTTSGALKEYDVKVGASTVATIAAAAGLSPKLTVATIGTVTPDPVVNQTGAAYDITVRGTGFSASSDSGVFAGAQIAGDGTIIVKLASITTALLTAEVAVQIRESLAADAKAISLIQSSNYAAYGVVARARSAAGSAAALAGYSAGVQPAVWLKASRAGNSFAVAYSTDGNDWKTVATQTIAMASTAWFGIAAASQNAATSIAALVQQVNINNVARPTYTHSTVTGGSYTIVARDLALNVAAASAPVIALPLSSTIVRRWNPGVWLSFRGHPKDHWPAAIAATSAYSWIKGILFDYELKQVEAAQDDYAAGLALIAADFLLAKNAGKKAHFRISTRAFGPVSDTRQVVPDYIYNGYANRGQAFFQNKGVLARIWEAPIADRLIAAFRAVFAAFDGDTAFDGMSTDETAITWSTQYPAPSGYSNAALLSQFQRLSGCRPQGTRANLFIPANYLGSDTAMEDLIIAARANKGGIGGPDTWNRTWVEAGTRAIQGDEIMRGERGSLHDYRPEIIVVNEVQATELGGYIASFSPAQVWDVAVNINRANYVFIDYTKAGDTQNGNTGNYWDTGFVPFFQANGAVTNTTLPTGY